MNKTTTSLSILGAILIAFSSSITAGGKEAFFVKVDNETTTQNDSQDGGNSKSKKEKGTGMTTGKRQHKPISVTRASSKVKKIPGINKTGDVTLKRGVIGD